MNRILWIAGLSFALLFYGAGTIGILYAGISHRHLNLTGVALLAYFSCISWFTFQYLRQKIRDGRLESASAPDSK
jgi:hypothetical protein